MKLCILFAVAACRVAAHRMGEVEVLDSVVESSDSKPKKKKGGINLLLVPGPEFSSMKHPVLSHQMEIKPGAPEMQMDIQETGSGVKANSYEVELVGPNGMLPVGKLGSKIPKSQLFGFGNAFQTKTKYEFKSSAGKSLLRMFVPMAGAMVGRKTAHVTNDVKKNPYTYWTFSHDGAAVHHGGGMASAGQVIFSVFKGKNMGFDQPYLQAKGHFRGWKFQFYLAGRAEPVAIMAMTDNKMSTWKGTTKQRYRIKMQSGVDPLMLSMLVGFIDTCNNR